MWLKIYFDQIIKLSKKVLNYSSSYELIAMTNIFDEMESHYEEYIKMLP